MERKRNSSKETRCKNHASSNAEFDVFLSFRGPDTRTSFADSLYYILVNKGIRVFIDNEGIDVGDEIAPEIFQAIDNSKICIPIFSRGYSSSSWCLRELEHMMERRKIGKVKVMPIYYDVEPFDVKLETDVYRDALTLHEEKHGAEIVKHWEEVLKEVTKIKGWETKNTGHGKLAHSIAQKVLVNLQVPDVHISDQLVVMDPGKAVHKISTVESLKFNFNIIRAVTNNFSKYKKLLVSCAHISDHSVGMGPGEAVHDISTGELLRFNFNTIKAATYNFSESKKLGQGGFGAVYKGLLSNGQEIAVKRLSQNSSQGEVEFKNEVMLLAKLQHKNLVKLLGFCLEEREHLLIYEFVPNSSLAHFIIDPQKRANLNWNKRHKIILGVAQGMLYLHEDSPLRIIHRDLKASNILLDLEMNPKISDFGMARLFELDQTQAETSRVMGTFGYMAPEYVINGNFSIKSDVFSFGVLVLEIVCGQRNQFYHVWKNWREGSLSNIIDPFITSGSSIEIARCIHIGLLCVQEDAASRPTTAEVHLMLSSHSLSLQVPSRPAFLMHNAIEFDTSTMQDYNLTVSEVKRTMQDYNSQVITDRPCTPIITRSRARMADQNEQTRIAALETEMKTVLNVLENLSKQVVSLNTRISALAVSAQPTVEVVLPNDPAPTEVKDKGKNASIGTSSTENGAILIDNVPPTLTDKAGASSEMPMSDEAKCIAKLEEQICLDVI